MATNLTDYVLLFFTYSVLGWCMETTYMAIREKHLTNRGFLLGPCCPIYGIGLIGITLLFQSSPYAFWYTFFAIIILCSVLEYTVSALMERLFHTRWWDYHDMKFNIRGRICLETMLPFGILGTFALYRINPLLLSTYHHIPNYILDKLLVATVLIFLLDLALSLYLMVTISLPEGEEDQTAEISKRVRDTLSKRLG